MRRSPVALLIALFSLVMAVFGYFMYWKSEVGRIQAVEKVGKAPSAIYARLTIRYDHPPVYEEEYRMQDVEGVTTYDYRIRSYAGKQITITAPDHRTYDVSFFFGQLQEDGVWKLMDKPPRGNTAIHYTVYVKQQVDYKQGDRTITFTDPHYWATVAGHQFTIDLSKQSPSDLLKMKSTQLADPHYQTVVNDFLTFGPPAFRRRIAAARAELHAPKL